MPLLHQYADFLLHLDRHLGAIVIHYGVWTYLIMFVIIFCETGLVVTPFLPGDSLLFVLGAMAASGTLQLGLLVTGLTLAAVGGNMLNYAIGVFLADEVTSHRAGPFVNQNYIKRTHAFFEKYGAKTIIITRFMPIIRTFAPFLAGVGGMPYAKFTIYNIIGGTAWVLVGVLSGFFFGNLPFVRHNFSWVILVIIGISLIPAFLEYLKHKKASL
ncbi:MAG: VTT domain-containing protein [Candidatus Omnitrophica bacterium]|nr:VTT domain-containing protein [Candidatus Omnitrophota bacterium]